ncbi:MBL fold metallo-hydrolase [Litorimonas sp. RW-G-Af-16]|uniref:MBL fold metallo-hydrolase n=1 Tax=Litorimonas sp. RW-G-Af-16 TaxID=3241168 RepID=UPI00390CC5B5
MPLIDDHPREADLIDGYWSVVKLSPNVFAIGEPRYYQVNWSYLIVGSEKALLFDTGPGIRDISVVVGSLTDRPVHAMVSHLHFDHIGGFGHFEQTLMLDVPSIRSQLKDKTIHPSRYQSLAFIDGKKDMTLSVTAWIEPGGSFDLGDRTLKIISAPGHTADSAVILDVDNKMMFTGDFLYQGSLYAMLPGSSRSAYAKSADLLISESSFDTLILGAHAPTNALTPPVLSQASLIALRRQLAAVEAGAARYEGVFPRRLVIDDSVDFLTGFPWKNR